MKSKHRIIITALSAACTLVTLIDSPALCAFGGTDFATEGELKAEIAKLQKKETRDDALIKLINYASTELFPSGSIFYMNDHPNWLKMAASAVNKLSKNEDVLNFCLEQSDQTAKLWAIRCVTGNPRFTNILARMAETDINPTFRIQALRALPKAEQLSIMESLKKHPPKDPHVLESLFENESTFNSKLAQALETAEDSDSRIQILNFIGSDGVLGLNPTPKHSFSAAVFNAVIKATSSSDNKERAAAAYALDRLKNFDEAESKKVFLQLARDSEPDVRWRAAKALMSQRGDKEVDEMFTRLEQDESSLVRSMTKNFSINRTQSPDELAKFSHEISELQKTDQSTEGNFKVPSALVPVNSAAATAWVGPKESPKPFLLTKPPTPDSEKRSIEEENQEMISAINSYVNGLNSEGAAEKATAVENSLKARLSSAAEKYPELRKIIDQNKAANAADLYVVNVVSSDWPRTERPYERVVHLQATNSPVILALMAGDQEGTRWQLIIDKDVDLQKIVLSGNGVRSSSVSGNFPANTPILSREQEDYTYTVWVPEEQNEELTNRREAFFSSHFGLTPTTIQNLKDKGHEASAHAPIIVGPANKEWCESLTKQLLKPLYLEAHEYANAKFRATFNYEFPMLINSPVSEDWNSPFDFNTGWCSHLKGSIRTHINGIKPLHSTEYAGLAYDPKTQTFYFATRRQVFVVDSKGDTTPILSPDTTQNFEKDTIRGIVYDTKRNRLIISSGNKTFQYEAQGNKCSELNFDRYSANLACYDEEEDILYARDSSNVFRINAETGALISHANLPLSNYELLKQMYVQGNNFVFVSTMFATAGGAKQLATVIDKRDGSIIYQGDCVFAPIKTSASN